MRALHPTNPARLLERRLCLAFLMASSLVVVTAQEQLTPATLANWSVTGAAAVADPVLGTVTVPAGGQLVRSFPVGKLVINMVSRPFFSPKAVSSPALEVGPATLTFVRDEAGGGMVMLGDQALPLPNSIPLAPDGRSERPIAFSFSYDSNRNEAVLSLDGFSYLLAATLCSQQLEVAVSAGAEMPWTINTLDVMASPAQSAPSLAAPGDGLPSADLNPNSASADIIPAQPATFDDAAVRKRAYEQAVALAATGKYDSCEQMALSRNHCQSGTSAGQVECANKLIRLALVMAGQGQTEAADELARRAWLHLRRIPPDTEPGVRANAEELAGLLYERLAGDTASAQRSYQNALKACPVSTWAREALDRMNRAAEINAKNQGRSPIGD